jgi:transketolase
LCFLSCVNIDGISNFEGADGPSQMGLEDIAMIRTIPNSIVFYPSDGVSTFKIAEVHSSSYQL